MDKIKQVILIRRDLKMRRGKEIAQGSHASMNFLITQLRAQIGGEAGDSRAFQIRLSEDEQEWVARGMAKVCLQVQSEEELLNYYEKAKASGLSSQLITDSGRTEFAGQPTRTACAIGPARASKIDAVTGDLRLY